MPLTKIWTKKFLEKSGLGVDNIPKLCYNKYNERRKELIP